MTIPFLRSYRSLFFSANPHFSHRPLTDRPTDRPTENCGKSREKCTSVCVCVFLIQAFFSPQNKQEHTNQEQSKQKNSNLPLLADYSQNACLTRRHIFVAAVVAVVTIARLHAYAWWMAKKVSTYELNIHKLQFVAIFDLEKWFLVLISRILRLRSFIM